MLSHQSFSSVGVSLDDGVDNFFLFSSGGQAAVGGQNLTSSIATNDQITNSDLGAAGLIARDFLACEAGALQCVVLRSSVAITVDIFIEVAGARSVVAAGVALPANTIVVTDGGLAGLAPYGAGQDVRVGINKPAGGTLVTDLSATVILDLNVPPN